MNHDDGGRERRAHARWPLQAEATVMMGEQWLGSHSCQNLSAGGMLLIGPRGLKVGDRLSVVIRIPKADPIEVTCEVRRRLSRSTYADAYGVSFEDLSADTEDSLHNMVVAGLERQVSSESSEITAS